MFYAATKDRRSRRHKSRKIERKIKRLKVVEMKETFEEM